MNSLPKEDINGQQMTIFTTANGTKYIDMVDVMLMLCNIKSISDSMDYYWAIDKIQTKGETL